MIGHDDKKFHPVFQREAADIAAGSAYGSGDKGEALMIFHHVYQCQGIADLAQDPG